MQTNNAARAIAQLTLRLKSNVDRLTILQRVAKSPFHFRILFSNIQRKLNNNTYCKIDIGPNLISNITPEVNTRELRVHAN